MIQQHLRLNLVVKKIKNVIHGVAKVKHPKISGKYFMDGHYWLKLRILSSNKFQIVFRKVIAIMMLHHSESRVELNGTCKIWVYVSE